MSNVIQIKRGASPPGENVLLPYELGYTVSRFLQDNTLVENSGGGYLYIGDLKQGDANTTLPVKIKAGYADTAYNASSLSQNDGMPREKVVTYWQGHSMEHLNYESTYYPAGASTENCLPSSNKWWHILRFNHSNSDSLYYTDLAIPFTDNQRGLCYKQVEYDTVKDDKWITIFDESNAGSLLIQPLSNGSLIYNGINSNQTQTAINLVGHWGLAPDGNPPSGNNPPVGWGMGIKFQLEISEPSRYAAIEAYANSAWANSTGLRFKTYSNEGDGDSNGFIEATFAKGIFAAPKFASNYATLTNLESYKVTSNIVSAENINIIKDNKETNLFDRIYPIGSIYMSVNSTNPAVLFGGTWEQLTDRFLIGAGNTFSSGVPGGNESVTLTEANLPSHNHGNVQASFYARDGINDNTDIYAEKVGGNVTITENASGAPEWGNGIATDTRKHYLTEIAINAPTGNTGSGTPFSILPPYLAVYMWKRIA